MYRNSRMSEHCTCVRHFRVIEHCTSVQKFENEWCACVQKFHCKSTVGLCTEVPGCVSKLHLSRNSRVREHCTCVHKFQGERALYMCAQIPG